MAVKLIIPEGLYGITAAEYSGGRDNITVVKQMLEGGIKLIQYREKDNLTILQKFNECREIRKMTYDYGAVFIINDFIDIAMLTDADGVHAGQDDLPVPEIRKLVGRNKIIGISTHNIAQALKAESDGADYIGVGPIYPTSTKHNVCPPVGLSYLDEAMKNVKVPIVAIGGIKKHNIGEVISHGARTAALVTEITMSENISQTVKELSALFQ